MKKLFLIIALAFVTTPAFAQFASDTFSDKPADGWLKKGYKGFVDLGFGGDTNESKFSFYATTTHGYQFSEWFYAGVGAGYLMTTEKYNYYNKGSMLTYLDFRFTIPTSGRIYPYLDLKGGGAFFDINSGYFSGSLGARYALTEKLGLSLGVYVNVVHLDLSVGPVMGGAVSFDF